MASTLWYFELLGRFRAESHARSIERFRTQKTASFLAYLVLHTDRPHARESLIDLFWPDSAPEAGQTNLRVALNSLRKQLEPPGIPPNSVLAANRDTVQIVASVIDSDVAQFENAVRATRTASDRGKKLEHGSEAIGFYKGSLLPGHYDDWILNDQRRLENLYLITLKNMIALCVEAGDVGTALEYALRALDTDPLNEDLHAEALRLYIAIGQPSAAVRHFQQLESTLRDQIDGFPSPEVRALIEPWIRSQAVIAPRAARTEPIAPKATPPTAESSPTATDRSLLNPALPPRTGPLYGREEECYRLLQMLQSEHTSVLTLMGPGGVGKTRLATELAHRMSASLPGSLAFVSLAEFTDPEAILFAVLQAFQLRICKQVEPLQALAAHLGDSRSLLVLDNFEQLVPSGIPEIRALRASLPHLKLLITSRHTLGIEGEQTFAILPLPVPESAAKPFIRRLPAAGRSEADIDTLLQNSSIRLFVERAQALRPDFQITVRNANDLAAICQHLEGMPLAIELAASWVHVLTPAQIRARFRFPSRTLGSRRRDISPRHRTVQNTVDWSYRLLSPALQQSLRVLSAFRGGWTLEALDAILDAAGEAALPAGAANGSLGDPVEILAELQERSLIYGREEKIDTESQMRYRMLESVREFCFDAMSSEERQANQQRHADYFLVFSRLARQDYDTDRQAHAIARLFADYENFLAAMEWFLNADSPEASLHGMLIAINLYGMWCLSGMNAEAKLYLERVLAHPHNQARTAERATALNSVARLYADFGDNDKALKMMYEALEIRRAIGNEGSIGASLNSIGAVLQYTGKWEEAFEAYRDAVALFRKAGRTAHVAVSLRNMGLICIATGDGEGADRYVRESLDISRRERYTYGIYTALGTLGNLDYQAGRLELARERYEECRDYYRETDDVSALTGTLSNLGRLYHDLGETPRAKDHLAESLLLSRRIDDKHEIILLFEHAAYVMSAPEPLTATRLCGAAQAARDAIHTPRPEVDVPSYLQFLEQLRGRIGERAFRSAFDAGLTADADAAIDFALAVLQRP